MYNKPATWFNMYPVISLSGIPLPTVHQLKVVVITGTFEREPHQYMLLENKATRKQSDHITKNIASL